MALVAAPFFLYSCLHVANGGAFIDVVTAPLRVVTKKKLTNQVKLTLSVSCGSFRFLAYGAQLFVPVPDLVP